MAELDFFEILLTNLSPESKWFLVILRSQKEPINKIQLQELVNKSYIKNEHEKQNFNATPLISSRHLLDIHLARLEGPGLVQVKELGRMRLYSITILGKQLLEYMKTSKHETN